MLMSLFEDLYNYLMCRRKFYFLFIKIIKLKLKVSLGSLTIARLHFEPGN